jgi:hypothetical protein
MKYEKIYDSKVFMSPINLSEELKKLPGDISLEEIKIIPVYSVQSSGGSELVGFKLVAYREVQDNYF